MIWGSLIIIIISNNHIKTPATYRARFARLSLLKTHLKMSLSPFAKAKGKRVGPLIIINIIINIIISSTIKAEAP